MRIDRAELRIGKKLGEGSQGSVYRVDSPREGLPFRSLIYKEFLVGTEVSGAALEALASLREGLTAEQRAAIDAFTVWPIATVVNVGRVTGYLMQEIPPHFLQTIATSSGDDVIPREVQHLFVADAITHRNLGESPNRIERIALCREAAFALGFLHGRNVVFGDFSYKNAVYSLRPKPSIMLLDCDAVRVQGQGSAVAQLNSPGWTAPERSPQTKQTDRYKLGLFILRCVTPEVNAQTRDPEKAQGMLDASGLALLRSALSATPSERPSGKVWVEYFDAVIARSGGLTLRRTPAPLPKGPAYRMARHGELKAPVVRRVPAPGGSVGGGQHRRQVVTIGGAGGAGVGGFGAPRRAVPSPAGTLTGTTRPASVLRKAPIYVTATGAPAGIPAGSFAGYAPNTSPGASAVTPTSVQSVVRRPPASAVTGVARKVVVAPSAVVRPSASLPVSPRGPSPGGTVHPPQLSATQSAALRAGVRDPAWKLIAGVWGTAIVLALVTGALAVGSARSTAGSGVGSPSASAGTRAPQSTSTATTRLPLGPPPAGAVLTDATPCPPSDGSAARTTTFAAPPPNCLVAGRNYSARVSTSAGSFTITLTDAGNRDAVNNFVVLSNYRYYEGTAFHSVSPQGIVGGDANGEPPGTGSPGYVIPWTGDTADRALPRQVYLAPGFGGGLTGQLVIGVKGGPAIAGLVFIGEVTDGFDSAVQSIVAAGTGDPPTRPISITAVSVSESAVQR